MQTPKFGFNQIKNPTPNYINLIVRAFVIVVGLLVTWLQGNPIFGVHTREILTSILGISGTIVASVAPLFGIEINSKSVPTDQVKSMEESK